MEKINWKKVGQSEGYQKLKKTVLREIHERYRNSPNGKKDKKCTTLYLTGCKPGTTEYRDGHCYRINCSYDYCSKFKWIIDRAKHYSHKTGVPLEQILDIWEADRDYSFENYYQESKQPRIDSDHVYVFENSGEFIASTKGMGFRCPVCKGVSSDPQKCDTGILLSGGKHCNWKAYGLFGTMGKGVCVLLKDHMIPVNIFKPVAFEDLSQQ